MYWKAQGLFFAIALLALLFGLASGCKKARPERMGASAIHAVSRDLANTAKSAGPKGTTVRIRFQASDQAPQATDRLDITLLPAGKEAGKPSEIAEIEQALNGVATRHGLTEQPMTSREGILIVYLKSGVPTHTIHIHTGPQVSQQNSGSSAPGNPELAIIVDDLGSDRAAAEAIFALDYPLTLSVLPNHEHSSEIAKEAQRRGYQVMLHLPMQSVAGEKPEPEELRPGMPAEEVSALLDQFLGSIPGAVGVNNHQGSQATADTALMDELMPALHDRHLFYVDSRTTAETVAYDTAQSFGVPSAFRNVPFLDDVNDLPAIRKQVELAIRGAREKGEAIAIGHPHAATLQALRETLPRAESEGVSLVFISELVH